MWIKPTLALIFLFIAFVGIGVLLSMILGFFGAKTENQNQNENQNLNELITDLRQNQSNIILIINNNTSYS